MSKEAWCNEKGIWNLENVQYVVQFSCFGTIHKFPSNFARIWRFLGDQIELIRFALHQVSLDTNLEYPQGPFWRIVWLFFYTISLKKNILITKILFQLSSYYRYQMEFAEGKYYKSGEMTHPKETRICFMRWWRRWCSRCGGRVHNVYLADHLRHHKGCLYNLPFSRLWNAVIKDMEQIKKNLSFKNLFATQKRSVY